MGQSCAQIKIRLSGPTKAAIEREAKQSHRSLNGQIVYMLEQTIGRSAAPAQTDEPTNGDAMKT
jgi:hypothetical protein